MAKGVGSAGNRMVVATKKRNIMGISVRNNIFIGQYHTIIEMGEDSVVLSSSLDPSHISLPRK